MDEEDVRLRQLVIKEGEREVDFLRVEGTENDVEEEEGEGEGEGEDDFHLEVGEEGEEEDDDGDGDGDSILTPSVDDDDDDCDCGEEVRNIPLPDFPIPLPIRFPPISCLMFLSNSRPVLSHGSLCIIFSVALSHYTIIYHLLNFADVILIRIILIISPSPLLCSPSSLVSSIFPLSSSIFYLLPLLFYLLSSVRTGIAA